MDKPIKIVFAGAYGIENAGDDLPLVIMCRNLSKHFPGKHMEFIVLTRHPSEWEAGKYGVKQVKNLEFESREEAVDKWFYGLNEHDDTSRLVSVRELIGSADLLILGAGNFFVDITIGLFRGPIPKFALYTLIARMHQVPVMLYGISAGPVSSDYGRELSKWLTEVADVVTVRDRDSETLLREVLHAKKIISVLPDSTLGGRLVLPSKSKILEKENISPKQRKFFALGLRDLNVVLERDRAEQAWSQLAAFLNDIGRDHDLLFIPQSTYPFDDDRKTAEKLAELLHPEVTCHIIRNRYHPEELMGLYSLAEATLAIRLHAAVFSVIAGTPVLTVNYLPKISGFMKSMELESCLIGLDELKSDILHDRFLKLMENRDALLDHIRHKVVELGREAENYANLAAGLIKRKL